MKKIENLKKKKNLDIFLYNNIYFFYDIYCPFIDFSSYHDNYFFKIPLNYIAKYNLVNDYKLFFEKNIKSNNLLYITFDNNDQIKILKEIKIDFLKAKKIYYQLDYKFDKKINIYDSFFSEIFLLIQMKNNLETLCLNFSYLKNLKIDNDVFNSLNDLKSLEHIELDYIQFYKPFKIILPNLKTIRFNNCKNIDFDENSTKNIKYLELDETDIKFGIKYKFDNLEVLNINKSNIDIEFISLTKIKSLKSSKIEIIENIINYSSLQKFSNLYISQLSFKEEQKLIELFL